LEKKVNVRYETRKTSQAKGIITAMPRRWQPPVMVSVERSPAWYEARGTTLAQGIITAMPRGGNPRMIVGCPHVYNDGGGEVT
jgi:hypothetical protein